jgi:citrate lyase subunit beta/citryl-CoA lyase
MTVNPADCIAPLFVSATRPDRFVNAAVSGAAAVIIDLEDAVAPSEKDKARDTLRPSLLPNHPIIVRINAITTRWFEDDLNAIKRLGLNSLMLPKTESRADIKRVQRLIGDTHVIAIIETVKGLANAREIGASGVARLAFGSLDYCADLGCAHEPDALLFARSEIVLASRLAGLASPLDGVTTSIENKEAVIRDARYAARLGFGGKLYVHPAQVSHVVQAFTPSDEELDWARSVLELGGDNAAIVAGNMVDEPVRLRARQILARQLRGKQL